MRSTRSAFPAMTTSDKFYPMEKPPWLMDITQSTNYPRLSKDAALSLIQKLNEPACNRSSVVFPKTEEDQNEQQLIPEVPF